MPAWSPEAADIFIKLARDDGRRFDQMQLQKLVYVAHGIRLAVSGVPLTGDRPEAWDYGPVYRRLSDSLRTIGRRRVVRPINDEQGQCVVAMHDDQSVLDPIEHELIACVYIDYREFSAAQLSQFTRKGNAPWAVVYAGGIGRFREIPHRMIGAQFVELATQTMHPSADY